MLAVAGYLFEKCGHSKCGNRRVIKTILVDRYD